MDQSLGKNQKLKSKKLIDKLFIEGQSVKAFPLKLVYTEIDQAQISDNKVAFSVPKKNSSKMLLTAIGLKDSCGKFSEKISTF